MGVAETARYGAMGPGRYVVPAKGEAILHSSVSISSLQILPSIKLSERMSIATFSAAKEDAVAADELLDISNHYVVTLPILKARYTSKNPAPQR